MLIFLKVRIFYLIQGEVAMKIKKRSFALLLLICIVCNIHTVEAADSIVYVIYTPNNNTSNSQSQTTKLSQLLAEYELFSTEVSQVRNQYMLDLSNSDLANEKQQDTYDYVGEIENSLSYIKNTKAELSKLKVELLAEYESYDQSDEMYKERLDEIEKELQDIDNQIAVLVEQLNSGTSTLDTATASYREAVLNASLNKFYRENMQLILNYEVDQLKFGVVKNLLSMMILKEQKNYYNSYESLIDIQIIAENKKIKLGLANQDSLEKLELEKSRNSSSIQSCDNTYQIIYSTIARDTMNKNSNYILEYSLDAKVYKEEDLILAFIASNPELTQLRYYINAYTDYMGNLTNEISKSQIKYMINSYDIQRTLLINNIRQYVNMAYIDYKETVLNLSTSQREITYYNKQYQAVGKKYNLGRATQLEVKKADVDLQNAYLKYYEELQDKMMLEYLFDNYVYNVKYK